MRIELDDKNSGKLDDAAKQLFDRYGLQVSPNQIVNIIIGSIETVELQQIVNITIRTPTSDGGETSRRKIIKSNVNWVFNWK